MSPTDCNETDGAFLDEAIGDLEAVAATPSARLDVATGDGTDLCRTPLTLGETLSESCAQIGGDPCR